MDHTGKVLEIYKSSLNQTCTKCHKNISETMQVWTDSDVVGMKGFSNPGLHSNDHSSQIKYDPGQIADKNTSSEEKSYNNSQYYIKDKLDFPIFEREWTASDELKLLEGIEKLGIDNWFEIHTNFLPSKPVQEIEAHFYGFYGVSKDNESMLNQNLTEKIISSKRDKNGRFEINEELALQNEQLKIANQKAIQESLQKTTGK